MAGQLVRNVFFFYKLIAPYSNFVRCQQDVYIIDNGVAILQYGSCMELRSDLQQKSSLSLTYVDSQC